MAIPDVIGLRAMRVIVLYPWFSRRCTTHTQSELLLLTRRQFLTVGRQQRLRLHADGSESLLRRLAICRLSRLGHELAILGLRRRVHEGHTSLCMADGQDEHCATVFSVY